MPVTAIINLRAISARSLPRSFHSLMHPVLLGRIAQANPHLAEQIHGSNSMAPFSLSPIIGDCRRVLANQNYWVRIGILSAQMTDAFLSSLEKGYWMEPIRIGENHFVVENVIWGRDAEYDWSGNQSYRELLELRPEKKISLSIESPLSFKRSDLNYPLPDPKLVYGNLARRWNLFADFAVPEEVDCTQVSFSKFNISTVPFPLRKGATVIGVIGKITFIFAGSSAQRQIWHALLRFAGYAGIGVKTPQGMGLCRIITNGGRR